MGRSFSVGCPPIILLLLMLLTSLTESAPRKMRHPADYEDDEDSMEAHVESGASEAGTGRVKIQVFRGPTRHSGDKDEEEWAPWGFYVSQPAYHAPKSSRYRHDDSD